MRTPSDPWHLARPELPGLPASLRPRPGVGPRAVRPAPHGQERSLKHDLLPAAEAAGYLAAYTNLWDDADHPGQAIATAILSAAKSKGSRNSGKTCRRPSGR